MSELPGGGHRLWPMLAAVGLPMLLYLSIVASGYDGRPYLRGDCPYYLATAQSLWADHDLDLSNQLPPPLSLHSGDVALDVRGRLVPKHPIWMPLVSMPLVVLLGEPGALVFNLLALGALLALLLELCRRLAAPWPAVAATSLTGALSFLPHYAYNYSPDVFLTVLLLAALVLLPHDRRQAAARHAAAGLMLGLLLTARPSFIVALPALPLLLGRPLRRTAAWTALGTAVPVLAWMALNTHLFGGPLVTAYDRIAELTFKGVTLHSHRGDFTLPLLEGLRGQLLDPDKGLVPTSAISLVSLLGLPLLLRRSWRIGSYVAATSLGLVLLFSTYRLWPASHHGNRFLMPLVALAALPLACLLDSLITGLAHRLRRGRHPEPQRADPGTRMLVTEVAMTHRCWCARTCPAYLGQVCSLCIPLAAFVLSLLLCSPAAAQEQVWVLNFPDQQSVSGNVRISEPVPVSRIERFEDVVVTAVGRHQTDQLVLAGTLETAGFSTVVLSLAAEIQGTVPRPAEIGVLLVPEEDVALRALKDGYLLFPIEAKVEVPAEAPPYVASTPEAHEVAFPRYRVYLYSSGKRTARVQVFALLRS